MSNVTQENGQHQTDARELDSDEGRAVYISRRPSWAENVSIGAEAIDYTWTAPTVPESIEPNGDTCPVRVEVTREDLLYVNEAGVVLDQGPERIFLIDANFDVVNARRLAAAIVECCDRIDGTEGRPVEVSNAVHTSTEGHAVWCDPEEHARAESDGWGAIGCGSAPIRSGVVEGWITANGPGGSDIFAVDWRPANGWEWMTPGEAVDLLGFLAATLAQYGSQRRC